MQNRKIKTLVLIAAIVLYFAIRPFTPLWVDLVVLSVTLGVLAWQKAK